MKKYIYILVTFCFFTTSMVGPQALYGSALLTTGDQGFVLPAPGRMISLSPDLNPPLLKGLKVDPNNPMKFEFILDQGDSPTKATQGQKAEALKQEASKLIKYFMAALTVPERDLWVNLSPYEKNRIVPQSFGLTQMGRDLLAEDYILKQMTASLIYPEGQTGREYWQRIYLQAAKQYGTTNIPVNTFNKVWIVPDKAVVYENIKIGTAYVLEAKLKVMLDEDYLSINKHGVNGQKHKLTNQLGSQIIRQIVIPELNKEVNQGANFAQLRQVYNSLILASWYKKKIKDSILAQVYEDKNKIQGLQPQALSGGDVKFIYQRYLQAFKKGVFNYIKEDVDLLTHQPMPRKYFSGGECFSAVYLKEATSDVHTISRAQLTAVRPLDIVAVQINAAMLGEEDINKAVHNSYLLITEVKRWDDIVRNSELSLYLRGVRHSLAYPINKIYAGLITIQEQENLDKVKKDLENILNHLESLDDLLNGITASHLEDEKLKEFVLEEKREAKNYLESHPEKKQVDRDSRNTFISSEYIASDKYNEEKFLQFREELRKLYPLLDQIRQSCLIFAKKNHIELDIAGISAKDGVINHAMMANKIRLLQDKKVVNQLYEMVQPINYVLSAVATNSINLELYQESSPGEISFKLRPAHFNRTSVLGVTNRLLLSCTKVTAALKALQKNRTLTQDAWNHFRAALEEFHRFSMENDQQVNNLDSKSIAVLKKYNINWLKIVNLFNKLKKPAGIKPLDGVTGDALRNWPVEVVHWVKAGETVESIILAFTGLRPDKARELIVNYKFRSANPWVDQLPSPRNKIDIRFEVKGFFFQKVYCLPSPRSFADIEIGIYHRDYGLAKGERAAALCPELKKRYGLNEKMPAGTKVLLGLSRDNWVELRKRDPNLAKSLSDEAMGVKVEQGGIDLTNNKLQISSDTAYLMTFHLDPKQLEMMKNASGFVPVIIDIRPLDNLERFLGVTSS